MFWRRDDGEKPQTCRVIYTRVSFTALHYYNFLGQIEFNPRYQKGFLYTVCCFYFYVYLYHFKPEGGHWLLPCRQNVVNLVFVVLPLQTKTYDSVTDKFMDFSFEKVRCLPSISKDVLIPVMLTAFSVIPFYVFTYFLTLSPSLRPIVPICCFISEWSRKRRMGRTLILTSLLICWRFVYN